MRHLIRNIFFCLMLLASWAGKTQAQGMTVPEGFPETLHFEDRILEPLCLLSAFEFYEQQEEEGSPHLVPSPPCEERDNPHALDLRIRKGERGAASFIVEQDVYETEPSDHYTLSYEVLGPYQGGIAILQRSSKEAISDILVVAKKDEGFEVKEWLFPPCCHEGISQASINPQGQLEVTAALSPAQLLQRWTYYGESDEYVALAQALNRESEHVVIVKARFLDEALQSADLTPLRGATLPPEAAHGMSACFIRELGDFSLDEQDALSQELLDAFAGFFLQKCVKPNEFPSPGGWYSMTVPTDYPMALMHRDMPLTPLCVHGASEYFDRGDEQGEIDPNDCGSGIFWNPSIYKNKKGHYVYRQYAYYLPTTDMVDHALCTYDAVKVLKIPYFEYEILSSTDTEASLHVSFSGSEDLQPDERFFDLKRKTNGRYDVFFSAPPPEGSGQNTDTP